jgi:hypothetical protein
MTTVTKFDRKTCRTVSADAEEALEAVAAKFGLTLKRESGRFSHDSFTAKFTFAVVAADGSGAPADFARKARMLGLPEDCYGKQFVTGTGTYEVTGLNLRAKKYPVLGKRVRDGKTFKFTAMAVNFGMKAA